MSQPYISDEHYVAQTDRDKAMATHLREMARQLNKTAKRFTPDCDPIDSLCGGEALHPIQCRDVALQDAIINYTRANWGKIGNISFAWGIIQITKTAYGACQ